MHSTAFLFVTGKMDDIIEWQTHWLEDSLQVVKESLQWIARHLRSLALYPDSRKREMQVRTQPRDPSLNFRSELT